MYEISGSIAGSYGRLRYNSENNQLMFTSARGTVWAIDGADLEMKIDFQSQRISVADKLIEFVSLAAPEGTEEPLVIPLRDGMMRFGREDSVVVSRPPAPPPQTSAPPLTNVAQPMSTTQPRHPSAATRTVASKVVRHGSTLHGVNLAFLIFQLCVTGITLIVVLAADSSASSRLIILCAFLVATMFVYFAYVAIEFIIQLGLLLAEWAKS
jgi:hypothetical protein